MVAFLKQENVTHHRISIPPQSCLQRRGRPVTSTDIDPPRARKYHDILEYSRGRWPTVSSPFSTLMAYLSNWLCNSLRATNLSPTFGSQIHLAIARQVTETVLCVTPAKLLKTLGCFWCPVFHLPIRSNAWLLSYGRSTKTRAKSLWKNSVKMKNYLSTNSRKRSIICQRWWKWCSLY